MNIPSQLRPIMEQLVRVGPSHVPQFRFDEIDSRFVWICDRDERIGLVDRQRSAFEWIRPHPDVPAARPVELPAEYHAPTQWGARVVLQWWLSSGSGWRRAADEPLPTAMGKLPSGIFLARPRSDWRLDDAGSAPRFVVRHRFGFDPEVVSEHEASISYDAAAGSYVLEVRARLTSPRAYFAEVVNLYAAGVYDNRPGRKKFQATIWSHPDGRWIHWPHNPVGYLTPGMNEAHGQRRVADRGFLGYFSEPTGNPVVEFLETSAPLSSATCSNLYDEHLTCLPAPSRTGADFEVAYRFFSVRHPVAEAIRQRSTLVQFKTDPHHFDPLRQDPFHQNDAELGFRVVHNPAFPIFAYNQVNDFEQPARPEELVVASMIWASNSPEANVYWDDTCGHSGNRSIRLRGAGTRLNGGPTPHLTVGQRYRLSAWIRCQGVEGVGASVRFNEIGMKEVPPIATHVAGPVTGTCDWTYVEHDFRAVSQLGWLYLDLVGSGTAWIDDLGLLEVEG